MNKTASTLSIRMQLPSEKETEKPLPQEEVIYLWDRIFIALLVIGVLAGAIGLGVWRWLQTPEPALPMVAQAVATTPRPTVSVAEPLASPPSIKPLTQPPSAPNQTEAQPAKLNVSAIPAKATSSPAKAAPKPAADVALPLETVPASRRAATVPTQSDTLAKVEILSDHLVHAQLSNKMHERLPVGHASAVIPMTEEGLVTVYFFTEFERLKGETLYYDWFLGDKRMARVRARPHRDTATAYSSKYIDKYMLGQWHVEVRTAAGNTLARADFEVR